MPYSELMFFGGWLIAALIGGAALALGWQRLYARHASRASSDG